MKIGRRKRALIVSAKGFGNIGDDIVSMVSGSLLKSIDSNIDIRYADLGFDHSEVQWADIVILGGGGVLYDSSKDNVDNYLRFIDHAHLMKKRVIAIGLGVQGIYSDYGKRRYRETLSLLDLLIVRDDRDADSLSSLGVAGPIFTAPDLAFLLPELLPIMKEMFAYSEPEYLKELRSLKGVLSEQKRPLVGMSVASEDGSAHVDINPKLKVDYAGMSASLATIVETIVSNDSHVVLFQQSRDDERLYGDIVEKYGRDSITLVKPVGEDGVIAAMDVYRLFDRVLTSRYHGFILAILSRTPLAIIDGTNSGKSTRAVSSFFPSLQSSIVHLSGDEAQLKIDHSSYGVPGEDEVNSTIVKARSIRDYVASFLA